MAEQLSSKPIDGGKQPFSLALSLRRPDAQKQQPGHWPALPEHKVTEILILGQQQAAIARGPFHHLKIAGPRRNIGHVSDIVPRPAQLFDQGDIDTFIK